MQASESEGPAGFSGMAISMMLMMSDHVSDIQSEQVLTMMVTLMMMMMMRMMRMMLVMSFLQEIAVEHAPKEDDTVHLLSQKTLRLEDAVMDEPTPSQQDMLGVFRVWDLGSNIHCL